MEHEYNNIIEEFGRQAATVLARLSLELIDLGRGQVSESLYTRGHQIKNLMGMVGSRMRRLIKQTSEEELDELKGISQEQERIFGQWVAYLRSMKQDPMNPTLVGISQLVRKITEVLSGRSGNQNSHIRFGTQCAPREDRPGNDPRSSNQSNPELGRSPPGKRSDQCSNWVRCQQVFRLHRGRGQWTGYSARCPEQDF